jgi:hypothetical protein
MSEIRHSHNDDDEDYSILKWDVVYSDNNKYRIGEIKLIVKGM